MHVPIPGPSSCNRICELVKKGMSTWESWCGKTPWVLLEKHPSDSFSFNMDGLYVEQYFKEQLSQSTLDLVETVLFWTSYPCWHFWVPVLKAPLLCLGAWCSWLVYSWGMGCLKWRKTSRALPALPTVRYWVRKGTMRGYYSSLWPLLIKVLFSFFFFFEFSPWDVTL